MYSSNGWWVDGGQALRASPPREVSSGLTNLQPPFTFPLTQLGQSPATSHAEERAARPGAGRVESLVLQGI